MRLKAMQEAGWSEVPVQVVDWSEEKQREFIIKDNVGFGEWDWDELANTWDAEELDRWGLDVPIFGDSQDEKDPFDDDGIDAKNQYGVIVICESAGTQESVFNDLTGMGYECKVVVT